MSDVKENPISKETMKKQLTNVTDQITKLRGDIETATVQLHQLSGIRLYLSNTIALVEKEEGIQVVEPEVK